MLKAALESLKRKGDTQGTQRKEVEQMSSDSPLSSQLSALLFSSSPPEAKQAKVESGWDMQNKATASDLLKGFDEEEDDLDELLKELDDAEELINGDVTMRGASDVSDTRDVSDVSDTSNVINDIDTSDTAIGRHVNTLDYCTEKEAIYSEVDSIYGTVKTDKLPMVDMLPMADMLPMTNKLPMTNMLPMIDISTPQIFSQKPSWDISDCEEGEERSCQFKVLLAETFKIEDLRENILSIKSNLSLNPVEEIRKTGEKRISFELALMLRDFRQMGSMAQLRLLDGNGDEIIGTLALSALDFKLHFGLILILTNVSIFSPVPGQKYLNITKQNIQSYHYNISTIRD